MNAFTELVRVATACRQAPPRATARAAGDLASTTTAELLRLLDCHGPMTTRELGDEVGLHTRLVWGLLKVRLQRGQVSHGDGLWTLNQDFQSVDVRQAVALLESMGYLITPSHREKPTFNTTGANE